MKNFKVIAACVALLLWMSGCNFSMAQSGKKDGGKPTAAKPKPTKRALIVAIADYDRKLGWHSLSSTYDLTLVKGALLQIGFLPADIDTLVDQSATKEGILAALKKLGAASRPGDQIFIHISSHGQQITDNEKPDEGDGYDEAIVAYGAPAMESLYKNSIRRPRGGDPVPPYDGRFHLRDDDLGIAIDGIRSKVGKEGHVLVTLDACHSGTGTRGAAIARGTEPPYDLEGTPQRTVATEGSESYGLEIKPVDGLGKFVLISGASAKEINFEAKDDNVPARGVGSLSYALSKGLTSMPANGTYRMLFARVASIMAEKAPNQSPQLEGDVDAKLFADGYAPQPSYFSVSRIINQQQLQIKAGRMANVGPGTHVSIKSNLDGKELATGEVVEADNLNAIIKLDRDITVKNAVDLQVHVTSYTITTNPVMVSLDSVRNTELKKLLTDSLTAKGLVTIGAKGAELTINDKGSRSGQLSVRVNTTAYDTPLMAKPVSGADMKGVAKSIYDLVENYVQGKTFRSMDMEDPAFRVEVRMIPVRGSKKYGPRDCEADTLSSAGFMDKGGTLLVTEGVPFVVSFRNTGTDKAYFNLIDLEANGKVSPVFPILKNNQVETPPEDFVLEPGKSRTFCHVLRFGAPYGMEILKVFASGVPFNLSTTINAKGAEVGTRGAPPTPLEKLVGKAMAPPATRGPTIESPKDEMGVNSFEYPFKIVPKK